MCRCGKITCHFCCPGAEEFDFPELEHIGSDITMYWIGEVQYATGVGEIAMACMVQEEYTNGDNIEVKV